MKRAESLIGVWTADTRFMLDQIHRMNENDPLKKFTGRIDLGSIGVAGHSFGGATAAQFCHDDRRCRAGIDIDGRLFGSVVNDGIAQPFLFLFSDHGNDHSAVANQIRDEIFSAVRRNPDGKQIVSIPGTFHFSFSDQVLTQSRIMRFLLTAIGVEGHADPRTGLATACRHIHEFFRGSGL